MVSCLPRAGGKICPTDRPLQASRFREALPNCSGWIPLYPGEPRAGEFLAVHLLSVALLPKPIKLEGRSRSAILDHLDPQILMLFATGLRPTIDDEPLFLLRNADRTPTPGQTF
jgi:hypothetical protein